MQPDRELEAVEKKFVCVRIIQTTGHHAAAVVRGPANLRVKGCKDLRDRLSSEMHAWRSDKFRP